jgi:MipA family protein
MLRDCLATLVVMQSQTKASLSTVVAIANAHRGQHRKESIMNKIIAAFLVSSLMFSIVAHAEDKAPDRLLMFGVGVGVMPEYEGGRDMRTGVLPLIQGRFGRFSLDDGLNYELLQGAASTLLISVGYDQGRRDERPNGNLGIQGSDHLRGMGRIDGAATAGLGASTKLAFVELSIDATRWLRSEGFMTVEAGMSVTQAFGDRLSVSVGTFGTWANRDYMQAYFGVSPLQAAASQFQPYVAKSGFKSVRAELEATYILTPKWLLVASVGDSLLLGDARNSPIVEKRNGVTGTVVVAYRAY